MPKTTIEIIFKFIAKNPASILILGGLIAILIFGIELLIFTIVYLIMIIRKNKL